MQSSDLRAVVLDGYHDECDRIRHAQARSRTFLRPVRRWAWWWGLGVMVALIVLCAPGCGGVTVQFEGAVQTEIAATAGDLAGWDAMTDAQQKASLAEAHNFARLVAHELGLYDPVSAAAEAHQ